MRHDTHYVDQLTRPSGAPFGRLIPLEDIDPNPNQPRQAMGDLSELVASIREKGILEPILVRPVGARFQIIAGERRYRAAQEVGVAEIPCVVRDSSDAETMELALVENLQRKDLSAFEEADALRILADTYGYTHEKMAEKLGKSRSSLTETLALSAMPEEVRQLCRLADISGKSLLLQIVRQGEPQKMADLIERLRHEGATREVARRAVKQEKKLQRGRPKHYVFRYQPRERSFSLALQFPKSHVPREDVVRALQSTIEALMSEDD
jgi:ParB family chromosome partitioning protein